MKIIEENLIASVVASSSETEYPDDNLTAENIGLVWKSVPTEGGPANATLTFSIVTGENADFALAVFGIKNAPGVSVAAKYTHTDPDVSISTQSVDLTPTASVAYDRFWLEYTSGAFEGYDSVTIEFTITLSGLLQYQVAEIIAGEIITIPDPQYGLSQSRVDKSIKQELAGGGYYIHDALRPRTMNVSWIMTRDTEFEALDSLYNIRGSKPLAMLIAENLNDDMKWCGYFHMTDAPTATHDMPSHSAVSLSLREAC